MMKKQKCAAKECFLCKESNKTITLLPCLHGICWNCYSTRASNTNGMFCEICRISHTKVMGTLSHAPTTTTTTTTNRGKKRGHDKDGDDGGDKETLTWAKRVCREAKRRYDETLSLGYKLRQEVTCQIALVSERYDQISQTLERERLETIHKLEMAIKDKQAIMDFHQQHALALEKQAMRVIELKNDPEIESVYKGFPYGSDNTLEQVMQDKLKEIEEGLKTKISRRDGLCGVKVDLCAPDFGVRVNMDKTGNNVFIPGVHTDGTHFFNELFSVDVFSNGEIIALEKHTNNLIILNKHCDQKMGDDPLCDMTFANNSKPICVRVGKGDVVYILTSSYKMIRITRNKKETKCIFLPNTSTHFAINKQTGHVFTMASGTSFVTRYTHDLDLLSATKIPLSKPNKTQDDWVKTPHSFAVDSQDRLWISDDKIVSLYDANGCFVKDIEETNYGVKLNERVMCFDDTGNLYITTKGRSFNIDVFRANGEYRKSIITDRKTIITSMVYSPRSAEIIITDRNTGSLWLFDVTRYRDICDLF